MRLNSEILNLNTLAYGTVFQTQVINWIQHLEGRGVSVRLVLTEPLLYFFSRKTRYDLTFITSRISSPINHIYAARPSALLSQLMISFQLAWIINRNVGRKRKVILQTRSSLFVKSLSILKTFFGSRLKIVFDSRGASAEEMIYQKVMDESLERRYQQSLLLEKKMIVMSDAVLCVSRSLISYHKEKTGVLSTKFHVNSCNADSGLFFFDDNLRRASRKINSILDTEKVFVYSGGMDMKWHIPKELIKLFRLIIDAFPDSKVLILTKDAVPVEFMSMLDNKRTMIKAVENEEINQYLNMSDYGIIIRENIPLNNVASPTKFAEYMLAGLPVLISEGLGDFSTLVLEQRFGVLASVPLAEGNAVQAIQRLVSLDIDRSRIASYGLINLSKESAIDRIIGVYKTLEDN